MYLVFLFAVIVVLLNLLIAQMSDTYAKVQEDVEGTFAIARARIIARLQKGKWLFCKEVRSWCGVRALVCVYACVMHCLGHKSVSLQSYRKRYFKKEVWTG